MRFLFSTVRRIEFGEGAARLAAPELRKLGGSRALVVTGASLERATWLLDDLRHENIAVEVFSVADEPTVETVRAGLAVARRSRAEAVIALGGGSAIDAGKAIGALAREDGDTLDYLEVVGAERALSAAPLPIIAIPTTAGTGAEVTRNAVLGAPEHGVKVSLRDDRLLPALALVDPTLTLSLSPRLTAETGLDAITQLIEPYLSPFSTPITDAFCREGIPKALHALPRAIARPSDLAARSDMALASLLGGLALANAKLGAVHGLAGVIGGRTGGAHGAICGRLLPHVLMLNVRALRDRDPANPARRRLDEVAGWIADAHDSTLDEAFEFLESRADMLGVARLGAIGLKWGAFRDVAGKSTRASSMRGNPIELTEDELVQVLAYAH